MFRIINKFISHITYYFVYICTDLLIKHSVNMVNQKLISLKLDSEALEALDLFCVSNNVKRNRVINDLVISLLSNMSTYQITMLIAEYHPDLLSVWYKITYDLDFD